MNVCQIHNGKISYILVVDKRKIHFQGTSEDVKYIAGIYQKLGYEIRYTGNGTSNVTDEAL